jgi:hypothetical protein
MINLMAMPFTLAPVPVGGFLIVRTFHETASIISVITEIMYVSTRFILSKAI